MPLVLCLQLTCEERTEAFQDSCDSDWLCFSYSARRLASLRVSCKDIPGCNLAYVSKSRIFKSSINRVFFWHHACGHTDLSQNHGSFHFAASNLLGKHDNQRTVDLRVTLLAALRLFISPTQCRDEKQRAVKLLRSSSFSGRSFNGISRTG
jgi:hypothetical protein